jgi:hypothetical protein
MERPPAAGLARRIALTCTLVAGLALMVGPGVALGDTQTAGNGIYTISIKDTNAVGASNAPGVFTLQTGASHPLGAGKNLLYGDGTPGTTWSTVRSYENHVDYVQHASASPAPGFTKVWLGDTAAVTTAVSSIAGGFRTTYTLLGPTATPDKLVIVQDVTVVGATLGDSRVIVKTSVTNNDTTNAVHVGVRYMWDYKVGADDGPTFQQLNPNGGFQKLETQFAPPAFETYSITDNDSNPSAPTYSVLGTATGPTGLSPAPTPPDLLQALCWTSANADTFDVTPDTTKNFADNNDACDATGGDTAVTYLWGSTQANAASLAANGGSASVSASPVAAPPGGSTPLGTGSTTSAGHGGGNGPGSISKRLTATRVSCTYSFATFRNTCTATVGDADAPPRSTPTGQVKFTHTGPPATRGIFIAGDTCQLNPTPLSPGVASCSVQQLPPNSGNPKVGATYLGSSVHNPSSGETTFLIAGSINGLLPGSPSLGSSTFPAAPNGPSFSKRKYGTKVTFTLKAPAKVRFTVEKKRKGRCPAAKKGKKRKKCKAYKKVKGSFTVAGKAGKNSFRFRGRIGGKTLKPRRYRLVAVPILGNAKGKARSVRFRIVK